MVNRVKDTDTLKAPRRRPPLVANGGRRTIQRLVAVLDDGTELAWEGTGSIVLVASTVRSGLVTDPEILYVDAMLKIDTGSSPDAESS